MYLYELALELELPSTDLVARAAAAGFPGLTPSTDLTDRQVTGLCAALGIPRAASGSPAPLAWGAPVPQPPLAAPPPPASLPQAPPPSRGARYVERRALRFAVGTIVVIVVAVGGMILRGGDSDDEAACKLAGNTMCEAGAPLAPGPVDRSGASTTATALGPIYGLRSGAPAVIVDLPRFCAGQQEFLIFFDGLQSQLDAIDPAQTVTREDGLRAWFTSQNEYPYAGIEAVVDSFGENMASSESLVLQDYVHAVGADVEDGKSNVQQLHGEWSSRVSPAVEELERAAAQHC